MTHSHSQIGGEFQVNTASSGDQGRPSVASLPGRGHIIVWQSFDGIAYTIFSQRYDASGVPQGVETAVSSSNSTEPWPSVTTLEDGGYIVSWVDSDGGGDGVYVQRFDELGAAQGGAVLVNTTTTGQQVRPWVAALADGGYAVAWQSFDGDIDGIFLQRFDAAGVAQGGEVQVNTNTVNNQGNVAIAGLSGGGYVVAWESLNQDGSGWGTYAQQYDASGVPAAGEFRVNTFTGGDQDVPAIAGLSNGGYVIVWLSLGQDGSGFGVYAQLYDASGVPQGGEFRVNTFTAGHQLSDEGVAALSDGGFVVTWWSELQDGSGAGIYAQRFDASGVPQGVEEQINTTTAGDQTHPSVAALTGGDYVIAWQSSGQDGSGFGIFAQRYAHEPITGTEDPDLLIGTEGDDVINGLGDNDQIEGRGGDDVLNGDGGADLLAGGSGTNILNGGDGADMVFFVPGPDTGVFADLAAGIAEHGDGEDFLSSIENIMGSIHGDVLNGDSGDNQINGIAGDDVIDGRDGHDFLFGQQGNDTLIGGLGHDFFRAGSGDDLVDGGDGFDRIAYFVIGGDTLPAAGVTVSLLLQGVPQDTGHGMDTLLDIEAVSGTIHDDTLIGDNNDNWLWGGTDLDGVGGSDTIFGNGGDDLIEVAPGDHTLDGGAGADTFWIFDQGSGAAAAGAAVSLLLQGTVQDTRIGMMLLNRFENISGTQFDDALIGDGRGNVLAGATGDDMLAGRGGDDRLYGDGAIRPDFSLSNATGPITLFQDEGGAGNDRLDGGVGADLLVGGGGNDELTGGAGHDRFEFGAGSGHDVVTDFEKRETISILDVAGVDEITDLTITQLGRDTLISWDGGAASVMLENFKAKHLSAENFDFGTPAAALAMSTPHMSWFGGGVIEIPAMPEIV